MQGLRDAGQARRFSGRAAGLFATQVFGAVVGIVNGILLARLLGPAGKGDYYLLLLVPSTMMVLLQIGLPQAFQFYSARGKLAGLLTQSIVTTILLSVVGVVALLLLMPLLRGAFLGELEVGQILFAFLALPLVLNATFTTGIVMGRQAVRWYALVNSVYPVATTVLLIVILGGLGPSVNGAVAVYLIGSLIQSAGFAIGARRVADRHHGDESASYRELINYGLPVYPGTLTQFFSYRADAYLIAFLLADPSEPLGYYSMAVGLAELVFFFPNAVSSLLFPHVAGSRREDSDRQVAMVSRVTLMVTAAVAIPLIPAAMLMIWVLLPAFDASIPPLLILLPGVVALSVTKVLASYVSGIGRPGVTSFVNVFAFALNIVANLVLVPTYGIVGAATASLLSYTISSVLFIAIAARLTGTPFADFWVPRVSDVRFTLSTGLGLVRRVRKGSRSQA